MGYFFGYENRRVLWVCVKIPLLWSSFPLGSSNSTSLLLWHKCVGYNCMTSTIWIYLPKSVCMYYLLGKHHPSSFQCFDDIHSFKLLDCSHYDVWDPCLFHLHWAISIILSFLWLFQHLLGISPQKLFSWAQNHPIFSEFTNLYSVTPRFFTLIIPFFAICPP